jgi:hypothetical protein
MRSDQTVMRPQAWRYGIPTSSLAPVSLPAFLIASINANNSGSTNVLRCGQMIEPADLA